MSLDFEFNTQTHGKWILSGEHSVVRGHSAIAFPIKSKNLTLNYRKNAKQLTANFSGETGTDAHLLFWSVLEHGMHLIGHSINEIQGHFELTNTIPVGAGMGASAALCVAVTRWFLDQNFIKPDNSYQFAKQLEDLFHGKSSGLDIACCGSQEGIYFNHQNFVPIKPVWKPNWYLSFCGQIGITAHCIKKVNQLWESDSSKAERIDSQMNDSVKKAYESLNTRHGLGLLKESIDIASDCFRQWGLISDSMQNHMKYLKDHGAIAAKPTGSGDGGYVLSLWDAPPKQHIDTLIAI